MAVEDALFIRGRVNRLEQLAEENSRLFEIGIKNQMFDLVRGLKSLSATVKQASKNGRAKYALKGMVEKMRNVISDAEHAICMYTVERKKHTASEANCIRAFSGEIQSMRDRVKKIKEDHAQAVQVLRYHTPITGASIEEPLNWLQEVVMETVALKMWIMNLVRDLALELQSLTAILRSALRRNITNGDVLKDVLHGIWKVVSNADDVISEYIWEREKYKEKGVLRYLESPAYYARVSGFAKELQGMRGRLQNFLTEYNLGTGMLIDMQPAQLIRMDPVVEEVDVVGFDEEAQTIKDGLIGGAIDLRIISIVGIAGLGKTTLAKMVFKDREVQYEFFTSIWIRVSKIINRKQKFLDILSNFTEETSEFVDMSEMQLGDKIKEYLEGGKYLIVLDDVRREDDWNFLKIAFPNNKKGSRVLVTSGHHNVGAVADSLGKPHQLKYLDDEECWELLKMRVFGREKCPSPLVSTGRMIARKSGGLPLAVVLMAGMLTKDGTAATEKWWKRIAYNNYPVSAREENQKMCNGVVIKLSYDDLSYELKCCFSYLAVFPMGHEIDAWKLICIWIAEGFIPLESEVTGEMILKELVDRNLVMVLNRRADGKIKTCRIHDTVHEFCRTKAASDYGTMFYYEIMDNNGGGRVESPRCISVHSSIIEDFIIKSESKASESVVRSFLSFRPNNKVVEIPREHLAVIPKSYPLVKVMDVESLKFTLLPKELYLLNDLRYLAVSTDLQLLPKHLSNLRNMQTLVLNTSRNSLEVEADIWSMPNLRHLHTNTCMVLPKNDSSGSRELLTLSTISPSSCTGKILGKARNLRKLGIRGNLAELMERKGGVVLFDNLQILDYLQNLKLININNAPLVHNSKLQTLLFPRRLRKMSLSNTGFEWKDINILGSLQVLEVLKLDENAFRGEFCDVSNIVFKQLRYLRIGRTNLVSWKVSKNSFPELKYLILRHCTALDAIPSDFGEVESLKVMDLFCTSTKAAKSARKIQKLDGFQLSIYPSHY